MGKYKPCFSAPPCSRVSGHHSSCGRTGFVFSSPATSRRPLGALATQPCGPSGRVGGCLDLSHWVDGGRVTEEVRASQSAQTYPAGPSCRPHARGGHHPPAFHLQPPRGASCCLFILSFQRGRSQTFLPSRVTQGVCRHLTAACEARLSGGPRGQWFPKHSRDCPQCPLLSSWPQLFSPLSFFNSLAPSPANPITPSLFPAAPGGSPEGSLVLQLREVRGLHMEFLSAVAEVGVDPRIARIYR